MQISTLKMVQDYLASVYNFWIKSPTVSRLPSLFASWTNILQFSSVAQLCPTLCNPVDCSKPGLPVQHQLPEFTQTHTHLVGDAIQPSHPLSFPSALNLSQHQGLFKWVGSLHQVAKVLELQLQHQSFQWVFRVDFLWEWLVWSPCCPKDSQESLPAPQFKSIISSVLCLLYGPALTSVHNYHIDLFINAFIYLYFIFGCAEFSS